MIIKLLTQSCQIVNDNMCVIQHWKLVYYQNSTNYGFTIGA